MDPRKRLLNDKPSLNPKLETFEAGMFYDVPFEQANKPSSLGTSPYAKVVELPKERLEMNKKRKLHMYIYIYIYTYIYIYMYIHTHTYRHAHMLAPTSPTTENEIHTECSWQVTRLRSAFCEIQPLRKNTAKLLVCYRV